MIKTIIRPLVVLLLLLLVVISPTVAAQNEQTPDFEKAWQEASSSLAYSFTCTVSSGSVKTEKAELEPNVQKLVDLTVLALKRYKSVTKGYLIAKDKRISVVTTQRNTLGILDAMVAGQLTLDEAIKEMKTISKKTIQMVMDADTIYFKGSEGWKKFDDAELTGEILKDVINDPITSELEKSSFSLKSPGSTNKAAVYKGTLSAEKTLSLLTPFIGAEAASEQPLPPAKLFITGDSHFRKYETSAKVVTGGLTFTVKEKCDIKLKKPSIKVPAEAKAVEPKEGRAEFVNLPDSY